MSIKLLIISILIGFNAAAQPLASGDILFVASSQSDFEQAINDVTQKNIRHNFSHVAIINVTDTGIFVVEASPKTGVIYSPIENFTNLSKKLYIGKLKEQYQILIPKAIQYTLQQLNKPYDFAFDFDNDQYYCSELIYFAFLHSSNDSNIFDTPPMTFKTKQDADFAPYWIDYFKKLNIDIPEGEKGINPNGIACSDKLQSLKLYINEH